MKKLILTIGILGVSGLFAESIVISGSDIIVSDNYNETIVVNKPADSYGYGYAYANNNYSSGSYSNYGSSSGGCGNGIHDVSCGTAELKESHQYITTAEVPVIYKLHPHTVHQYQALPSSSNGIYGEGCSGGGCR